MAQEPVMPLTETDYTEDGEAKTDDDTQEAKVQRGIRWKGVSVEFGDVAASRP